MTEENETGITGLIVYKTYRDQINDFSKINSTLVFDYESKKGNKEARSHVAKMKKVKVSIEKTRISEAKTYREALNSQADEIKAAIDMMILVHQKPLDAFEQKETIRIDAIKARINAISSRNHATSSKDIQSEIDLVNLIDLDESWDEFLAQAITEVSDRLKFLNEKLVIAKQYESDQAELAKLRKEKEEREAREEDKRKADDDAKKQAKEAEETKAMAAEEPKTVSNNQQINGKDGALENTLQSAPKLEPRRSSCGELIVERANTPITLNENNHNPVPASNLPRGKTVKEKRIDAEEDFAKLGFSKEQCSILIRSISFGKVRHIKFDL